MGPDRRIADYISANRSKYTREAITQQLLDSGYEQGAIDATWAALDTPDPDEVVGERFWGRFWAYLIGLNVAALLLVAFATQMIPNAAGLAAVLGVILAIGAAIALGIVAVTRPARLRRGAAIAIGGLVPFIFTFLIAGSCYALVSSLGPFPPPPVDGTLTVRIDAPMSVEATGPATCQPPREGDTSFNVYPRGPMSSPEGPITVYVSAYSETIGGEPVPSATIGFGDLAAGPEGYVDYGADPRPGGTSSTELAPGSTATSGSLTFAGYVPLETFDEQGNPVPPADADPISGTVTWSCES